jgi:hypothetical protein
MQRPKALAAAGLIRYKAKSSLTRRIGLKMHSLETMVA